MKRGEMAMKRVLAMVAILGVLVVPVLVSAEGETVIPPEANWTPTPPTPPLVAVEQPRTVSTPHEQSDVRSPAAESARTGYLGNWDPDIAVGD
jgi:hypothetical protein